MRIVRIARTCSRCSDCNTSASLTQSSLLLLQQFLRRLAPALRLRLRELRELTRTIQLDEHMAVRVRIRREATEVGQQPEAALARRLPRASCFESHLFPLRRSFEQRELKRHGLWGCTHHVLSEHLFAVAAIGRPLVSKFFPVQPHVDIELCDVQS